jgi:uncharacterized protein
MNELIVSELWIYPIKSLGGIRVKTCLVKEKGFELDRRWMLIDNQHSFLTQRKLHCLAEFKIELSSDELIVKFREFSFRFTIHQPGSDSIRATVWNSEVDVIEVSKDASFWFSEMIKMDVRLIFFPEGNLRKIEEPYQQQISLADAYPILTIGQGSLDDLNSRMEEPLPMNRFRPNLVFTGGEPYEEDDWKSFRIGTGKLWGARKSYRCIVTTIDQVTGIKGREPLLTLSKYRREANQIYFGLNTLPLNQSLITEGDRIIVEPPN